MCRHTRLDGDLLPQRLDLPLRWGPPLSEVRPAPRRVSVELVCCVGSVGEVRPVLQCLLQRLLLHTSLQQRITAIEALSQLVSSAGKLVVFAGLVLRPDPAPSARPPDHLALFRSFVECLGECEVLEHHHKPSLNSRDSSASQLTEAVVSAIERLLSSLEVLASGEGITPAVARAIDRAWATLPDADYTATAVEEVPEVVESQDCAASADGAAGTGDGENAHHFVCSLSALLPRLLTIRSTIEVDEALLAFASDYCEGVFSESGSNSGNRIILNADGIYLATYSALCLNLQLIECGWYCSGRESATLPTSQREFVEEVHGSGVLVYLSASWLQELHRLVCEDSLLQRAGFQHSVHRHCALVRALSDVSCSSGADGGRSGTQLLSDHRRLLQAATAHRQSQDALQGGTCVAGTKLCRRILSSCWDTLLSILGSALRSLSSDGRCGAVLLSPFRSLLRGGLVAAVGGGNIFSEEMLLARCLGALQAAARLATLLGLQSKCGLVFSLLSTTCLPDDVCSASVAAADLSKANLRLYRAHVLSLHVIMSSGLELASHAPECWGHIFRCCVYISELERVMFSESRSGEPGEGGKKGAGIAAGDLHTKAARPLPGDRSTAEEVLACLCRDATKTSGGGLSDQTKTELLSPQRTADVVCALSLMVDRLFDEAATQLNLQAVLGFLRELCAASRAQLFPDVITDGATVVTGRRSSKQRVMPWRRLKQRQRMDTSRSSSTSLLGTEAGVCGGAGPWLLQRLAAALLRLVQSGRPLLHVMKSWAVVAPHLMEAACHKDRCVTKTAVATIHDVVNCLLANQTELPHFHFNEAVFKPFQNLLCLEMCDFEVQDQIVSSICEFVEGCALEIKSGWRPLFAALRAVRPPPASPLHSHNIGAVGEIRLLRDIFDAFLATDNLQVFANAAVDCILCLLNHVKGTGGGLEGSEERVLHWGEVVAGDELCINALRYLHATCAIIAAIITMPACPIFHAPSGLCGPEEGRVVDCFIGIVDEELLARLVRHLQPPSDAAGLLPRGWERALWPHGEQVSLSAVCEACDGCRSRGLLVWYSLLSGLAGTVMICQPRCQPHVLDTLFSLMRTLPQQPGLVFGMYCVNHVLLPLLQDWLRRPSGAPTACPSSPKPCPDTPYHPVPPSWEFAPTFKQYVGLTTDLVVEYLNIYLTSPTKDNSHSRYMKFIVLHFRHVVCSCGPLLPPHMWTVLLAGLTRAVKVSLYPTLQLVALFRRDSPNFYGDLGRVQVAARRDCTEAHTARLKHLANQVFLLESQHQEGGASALIEGSDAEDRSFIFLLYPNLGPGEADSFINDDHFRKCSGTAEDDETSPPNTVRKLSSADLSTSDILQQQMDPIRVPFRSVVIGLLSNQVLLQTIGSILIDGSCHIIPSLANVLMQGVEYQCAFGKAEKKQRASAGKGTSDESIEPLPGLLRKLRPQHIFSLLSALDLSYSCAVQFDMRPGLKFLIQKVAMCDRAANLYRQAGASWTVRAVTLIHLVLDAHKKKLVTVEGVREVLQQDMRVESEGSSVEGTSSATSVSSEKKAPQRPTTLLDKSVEHYIKLLSEGFKNLCDVYLDLRANKEKREAEVDDIGEHEPLFFLSIKADEFSTEHRNNIDEWERSLRQFDQKFMKGKIFHPDVEEEEESDELSPSLELEDSEPGAPFPPADMELPGASEDNASDAESTKETPAKKPFMLSDFVDSSASSHQSDSDDSSLAEFGADDSGVASVTGEDDLFYIT
ncbi:Sec7 C-terminal [Trinorchestia longiramus]|nr:Sec7 C-terminal [Trinorchestia longiramus]